MILDCKPIQTKLKQEIVDLLPSVDGIPTLMTIRIGSDSGAAWYESALEKQCKALGIKFSCQTLVEEVDTLDVWNVLKHSFILNACSVLLLQPFPKHIDTNKLYSLLPYQIDADGASTYNKLGVYINSDDYVLPCTVQACLEVLYYYNIDVSSKNVVVIGRSQVVGLPLSLELQHRNATVTMCHSKTDTEYLNNVLLPNADVVISCAGSANLIDGSILKDDCVALDVGTNNVNGTMVGDVDTTNCNCSYTTVPGGIGSLTTLCLLRQVVKNAINYDDTTNVTLM